MMSKNVYSVVGANVLKARLVAGLSQSDVAKILGVSYQQVQKYENAYNRIPLDKLMQISKALKVPLLQLFSGAAEPENLLPTKESVLDAKETHQILTSFKALPKEVRHSVLKMVQAFSNR